MKAIAILETIVEQLIDFRVIHFGRIGIADENHVTPIYQTLLFEREGGYLLLRYTQNGLLCGVGATLDEAWFPIGFSLEEGEWLTAIDIETDVSHIIFPLYVNKVDGWIGIGSYDDILALSLCGTSGDAIAFTTAADYIEIISPEAAMATVRKAAIGQHLRIEGVTFASNSLI